MKRLILAVTVILMTLAYPVYADGHSESGAYAGLKTGTWKYTGDPQGTLNSSSMGIFAGYKLHPNLAVELDYLYNTEASASNHLENNSTQSNSYILALRPILPLNDHWELFANPLPIKRSTWKTKKGLATRLSRRSQSEFAQ